MQHSHSRYDLLPGTPLPARTIATFKPMTFLENLQIDAEGNVVATGVLDGRLCSVPFGGSREASFAVQMMRPG